jgi:hypothetical protein
LVILNNPAFISYASNPTSFGTITSKFVPTSPGNSGLPITESGDVCANPGYAYWSITANGLSGSTYSLNLYANGFFGVGDYTSLHIFRRSASGSPFALRGSHAAGTGSNAAPVANRTLLNVFGHFGIFSGSANPLPVKLLYFNAKPSDKRVKLSWATASELNNAYFTIERSDDAQEFVELFSKPGAGNTTYAMYYVDVDENPLPGNSYYRLKQTDYDGHFTYSDIKAVKFNSEIEEETEVKINSIFPNPFTDHFMVSFNMKSNGVVDFQLISSEGKVVFQDYVLTGDGNNFYEFTDHWGMKSGIYFANIIYNDKKVVQKIIKK